MHCSAMPSVLSDAGCVLGNLSLCARLVGRVAAESRRVCGRPTKGLGWQGHRASPQMPKLCWEAVLSCSSAVNSHCIPQ
jgi:hypothetical protein